MGSSRIFNRASKLFQPMTSLQKNTESSHNGLSKSQKLMLDNGIIRQSSPGCFHLLPLATRSLNKLTALIENEMKHVDAQKVLFPTLTNAKLWTTSGRYNDVSNELLKVKDRHGSEYLMSPTHEEAAADLIASVGTISYKNYPLRLYQISSKYRDEMKPRFGLMRARQFIMKDLYSFDTSIDEATKTYEEICQCYNQIFDKINIPWVKVLGFSGTMGGSLSHEYHFLSEVGEDKIFTCNTCNYIANIEYLKQLNNKDPDLCPNCSGSSINTQNGIEVGHTFFLGDKYSQALKAIYLASDGKKEVLQMGSYGLGVSRILAASLEVASKDTSLQWPSEIVPYKIVIIGPKKGSKEDSKVLIKPEEVYQTLDGYSQLQDDILLDDRSELTIGKRVLDAKRTGYPFAVIVGNKATQSPVLLEVIDVYKNEQHFLNLAELQHFFQTHGAKCFVRFNC